MSVDAHDLFLRNSSRLPLKGCQVIASDGDSKWTTRYNSRVCERERALKGTVFIHNPPAHTAPHSLRAALAALALARPPARHRRHQERARPLLTTRRSMPHLCLGVCPQGEGGETETTWQSTLAVGFSGPPRGRNLVLYVSISPRSGPTA